jgi:hypothetical protein
MVPVFALTAVVLAASEEKGSNLLVRTFREGLRFGRLGAVANQHSHALGGFVRTRAGYIHSNLSAVS